MDIGEIERIGVREVPVPQIPVRIPAPVPARREPAPVEPARREREQVPA